MDIEILGAKDAPTVICKYIKISASLLDYYLRNIGVVKMTSLIESFEQSTFAILINMIDIDAVLNEGADHIFILSIAQVKS